MRRLWLANENHPWALIGPEMSWWIWSTTFDTHFPATDTDIILCSVLAANIKNLDKLPDVDIFKCKNCIDQNKP